MIVKKYLFVLSLFIFNPLNFAHAKEPECVRLLNKVAAASKADFDFQHRSFYAMAGTNLAWLFGSQAVLHSEDYWSKAFKITLITDSLLTMTTHWITMREESFLKNLIQGKAFGPKYEAVSTILSNMAIGIAYIHGSWIAFGVDVNIVKSCLAVGLCAVVYPTLYFIKTRLFKKIPKYFDRKILEAFRSDPQLGRAFLDLETAIKKRGQELGLSDAEIESREVSLLENLLKAELSGRGQNSEGEQTSIDVFGEASERFLAELRKRIASKYKWAVTVANIDSFFSVGIAGQLLNKVNMFATGH